MTQDIRNNIEKVVDKFLNKKYLTKHIHTKSFNLGELDKETRLGFVEIDSPYRDYAKYDAPNLVYNRIEDRALIYLRRPLDFELISIEDIIPNSENLRENLINSIYKIYNDGTLKKIYDDALLRIDFDKGINFHNKEFIDDDGYYHLGLYGWIKDKVVDNYECYFNSALPIAKLLNRYYASQMKKNKKYPKINIDCTGNYTPIIYKDNNTEYIRYKTS